MRMHGRDMVSVDTVEGAPRNCVHCQFGIYAPRSRVFAVVCDLHDPEFALCEACWMRWDILKSGLPAKLAQDGIQAYRSIEIHTGSIRVSKEAARTLDIVAGRLQEAELSA